MSRSSIIKRNHYKSLGDKTALGGLAERLKEIQQQQNNISNLSSKKNAGGILSSVELAQPRIQLQKNIKEFKKDKLQFKRG